MRIEIAGKGEADAGASAERSRLVAALGTMCRRPLGSNTITWSGMRLTRTGSSGSVCPYSGWAGSVTVTSPQTLSNSGVSCWV